INKSLNDIVSTCILYGLDEKNATDLIIKNTSTDNQFVLKGFIDDARNLNQYRRINTTSGDNKVYGDSEASRYLEAFNSITPKEYLSLRMNANPPSFMLKELENLKTQSGFSNPIINVVLDYSLKRTKGEFNVSFIEKVAASLSIQGVNSAYDAMVKLDNRDFEVSQIANRKSSVRKDTSKKPSQDKPQTEKTEEELKKQQEDLLKLGKFFKI
ncbi:MAG: DnaD domain protein, partial [Bacilli bacterium]